MIIKTCIHKALETKIRLVQLRLQRMDSNVTDKDLRLMPALSATQSNPAPGYITGRTSVTWQDVWVMAVPYCTHTDGGLRGGRVLPRGRVGLHQRWRKSSDQWPIVLPSAPDFSSVIFWADWNLIRFHLEEQNNAVSLPNGWKQKKGERALKLPQVYCKKTLLLKLKALLQNLVICLRR